MRRLLRALLDGLRLLCAGALLLAGSAATAQSLEGVLMPGPVIQGHAKYENECRKCHVPFDRPAQDALCRDCHKEIGADVRERRGYHGRIPPDACRSCHTDHKGRGAQIVKLDEQTFDHKLTDLPLLGGHAAPKVKCASCHQAGRKYREAPGTCNACHRKDDVHKGRLGEDCRSCHTDVRWTEVKFDHDKTKFALRNK
ncbi:MAG: cytochrome c3 family protein, partial [Burkholderiaceae bacterium]